MIGFLPIVPITTTREKDDSAGRTAETLKFGRLETVRIVYGFGRIRTADLGLVRAAS